MVAPHPPLYRVWSSTNIDSFREPIYNNMNSSEDIYKYSNNNCYWSNSRGNITNNNFSNKSPKKDKMWFLGGLFRRKKKNESGSSSEEENKRTKKCNKNAKNKTGFDHILFQTNPKNGYSRGKVFSEPDCKAINNYIPASEFTHMSRKNKRDAVKARAEARIRDSSRGDSSEDDSVFRSDESSTSSSKKSRSARTQRYFKRHSKDGEVNTNSDDLWKPHINFSGLLTIPPSNRTVASGRASSFCDYDNNNRLSATNHHHSISCDGNIHYRTREALILPPGISTNVHTPRIHAPPPPPPRDLTRNMQNGETRPTSFSLDYKTNSEQCLRRVYPRITTNHSASEDRLFGLPNDGYFAHKPSSITYKSNDYRYLTDKNPRSRKPISVMQTHSIEPPQNKETNHNCTSPVMFTSKTQVTTNIFTKPETTEKCFEDIKKPVDVDRSNNCSMKKTDKASCQFSSLKIENESRKSTNLEEALDELEEIYKSLHLGDEDLLDRATERESLLENTIKPKSKAEPDLKSDDMAYRKYNKEHHNSAGDAVYTGSYLLSSPVFGGTFEDFYKGNSNKEPDITHDDVVYRNVKHTNSLLKINEPQPPFGIPVGPVLPSVNSDYLHAAPVNYKKSKKLPDIVKDDLAYRNLRKDSNKEPALPQTHVSRQDYLNNNNYKKKRAVRSLSANIYNLMHQKQKPNVFDTNTHSQNIDDVADALQMAREILKDKENRITATRKAFMSDSELKTNKFESRNHNQLQVHKNERLLLNAKPPVSPKGSTPICSNSPDEDAELEKALQHSTLEELLTSLARETSEHITLGLNNLEESSCGTLNSVGNSKDTKLQDRVEAKESVVLALESNDDEHDYVNIESKEENEFLNPELAKLQSILDDVSPSVSKINESHSSGKGVGETCVDVTYIALPTNGYSNINKTSFDFNKLSINAVESDSHAVFKELTRSLTQLVKSTMDIELNTSYNPQRIIPNDRDSSFYQSEKSKDSTDEVECLETNEMKPNKLQCLNDPTVFQVSSIHLEQKEVTHINNDFDSLKSPKLVQKLSSNISNQSALKSSIKKNCENHTMAYSAWYEDPSVVAFACSCGIACSSQLPLDLIAALGLVFVVISILLAIITRN